MASAWMAASPCSTGALRSTAAEVAVGGSSKRRLRPSAMTPGRPRPGARSSARSSPVAQRVAPGNPCARAAAAAAQPATTPAPVGCARPSIDHACWRSLPQLTICPAANAMVSAAPVSRMSRMSPKRRSTRPSLAWASTMRRSWVSKATRRPSGDSAPATAPAASGTSTRTALVLKSAASSHGGTSLAGQRASPNRAPAISTPSAAAAIHGSALRSAQGRPSRCVRCAQPRRNSSSTPAPRRRGRSQSCQGSGTRWANCRGVRPDSRPR